MRPLLRVVLDTNIYISGLVFGGSPASVLASAIEGLFTLCVSADIREEVESTLREKFEWSDDDIAAGCRPLWEQARNVTPGKRLAIVAADPDDDRILECALAAEANVLVTGDDHLLNLTDQHLQDVLFKRSQILTLREFLARYSF